MLITSFTFVFQTQGTPKCSQIQFSKSLIFPMLKSFSYVIVPGLNKIGN